MNIWSKLNIQTNPNTIVFQSCSVSENPPGMQWNVEIILRWNRSPAGVNNYREPSPSSGVSHSFITLLKMFYLNVFSRTVRKWATWATSDPWPLDCLNPHASWFIVQEPTQLLRNGFVLVVSGACEDSSPVCPITAQQKRKCFSLTVLQFLMFLLNLHYVVQHHILLLMIAVITACLRMFVFVCLQLQTEGWEKQP